MSDSEMKRPLFSRDLPESKARTNVAPLGAEGSEARARGQKMCGYSRDRSARLPTGRRAHVAAESYRFGIFWDAPLGGSTGSAGGNEVAAPTVGRKCHLVASSAGVGQGGHTAQMEAESRPKAMTIIIIIARDNKKIIIGIAVGPSL